MNSANNLINDEELPPVEDQLALEALQKSIESIEEYTEEDPAPQEESANDEELQQDDENSVEEEVVKQSEVDELSEQQKKDKLLWKLKKDGYRIRGEKDALIKKNEELQKLLDEALNSGAYHYGKSAYSDLERAKADKRKAIEEGDIEGSIEADIALNRASNAVIELEKYAYRVQHEPSPAPATTQEYNEQDDDIGFYQEKAEDFLNKHPYLDPEYPAYDSKTATKVVDFIRQYDAKLSSAGRKHELWSTPYFKVIDNYISDIRQAPQKATKNLNSVAPVGGIRNSYMASGSSKSSPVPKITLSVDQKNMCRALDITETDFIKNLIEDFKQKGKK